MQWTRPDLDAALEGIFEAIKNTPHYTTKGRDLRELFTKLGGAALEEKPFTITVNPNKTRPREPRDESFQKVVDMVRNRRRAS